MRHSLLALAVFLATTSCTGPTTPSPGLSQQSASTSPSPSSALVPLTAEITMTSVAPSSGATITVGKCFTDSARLCSHEFLSSFNVQVNQELQNLVLTVSFWDTARRCGYAADIRDGLAANTSASLAPSVAFLSWEQSSQAFQPCSLPVTTTRLVAELWTQHDHRSISTREFAGTYTFIQR
jgi:hypothetical protein